MRPTAELRNDHVVLRAKLELLEGLLSLVQTTQFPLRELTSSIARRLRCHTEKEEVLLVALRDVQRGPSADITHRLPAEHADQQETLHILQGLLAKGPACPSDEVTAYGAHLIDALREHMANEEERVFPAIDRLVLVTDARNEEVSQRMRDIARHHYPEGEPAVAIRHDASPITPEMTVNHVLRVRPEARAIFERFQVDWEVDGHHCLDELYWRRGVDGEALLQALNQSTKAPHLSPSAR